MYTQTQGQFPVALRPLCRPVILKAHLSVSRHLLDRFDQLEISRELTEDVIAASVAHDNAVAFMQLLYFSLADVAV